MSRSFHNKTELSLLLASHGEDNDAVLTSRGYEIATIYFNYLSKGHSEQTDSVHSIGIKRLTKTQAKCSSEAIVLLIQLFIILNT